MYTIDTLREINSRFLCDHRITQGDVDMANMYVRLIESTRSTTQPKAGDMLRLTDQYGEYYGHAHIEKISEDNEINYCASSYVPFIGEKSNGISCNTSGGPWGDLPIAQLKYVGVDTKFFCDWGNCGACGNGAVEFEARVSVWEYVSRDNPYAPFTTRDYDRQYISYCVDECGKPKNGSPYRYFGDGIAFVNTAEYKAWLKTYKGTEFTGNWENQTVVFLYKEHDYLISKDEWEKLNLPVDTRQCNGIVFVKVRYDDTKHCIDTYRFTNDGSAHWKTHKPYELNRNQDYYD